MGQEHDELRRFLILYKMVYLYNTAVVRYCGVLFVIVLRVRTCVRVRTCMCVRVHTKLCMWHELTCVCVFVCVRLWVLCVRMCVMVCACVILCVCARAMMRWCLAAPTECFE